MPESQYISLLPTSRERPYPGGGPDLLRLLWT